MRFIFCFLAYSFLCLAAQAEDDLERLDTIEQNIQHFKDKALKLQREANEILESAQDISAKLSALGAQMRAHENMLLAATTAYEHANTKRLTLKKKLSAQQDQLNKALSALIKLGQVPKAMALVETKDPMSIIRGTDLVSGLLPKIQKLTTEYQANLHQMKEAEEKALSAHTKAYESIENLKIDQITFEDLLEQKSNQLSDKRSDLKSSKLEMDKLRREARTLRELLEGVKNNKKPSPSNQNTTLTIDSLPKKNFKEAKGNLGLPIVGILKEKESPEKKGIYFSAPAYSRIYAPWWGEIRFAGPFRRYGEIIILEPEENYLILLTNLGQIDRQVGDWVHKGEPLGRLAGPDVGDNEFLIEVTQDVNALPSETLIMEIRHKGETIETTPWVDPSELRFEKKKVSGL